MKKSRSAINVVVLRILIETFVGNVLLHISHKENIGPKNRPRNRGFRPFKLISLEGQIEQIYVQTHRQQLKTSDIENDEKILFVRLMTFINQAKHE